MNRYSISFFISMMSLYGFSQDINEPQVFNKNDITKPSILSTHSFGVYFSRIQGHFKSEAPKTKILSVHVESGNVWSSPLKTYIPKEESDRAVIRNYNWDQAHTAFDETEIAKDSFTIKNDGVIKGLRAQLNVKLAEKHELQIGLRVFMLTKGKTPFSIFTGDEFIENFHENIAGGDDPFDRKVFGLNQAGLAYNDRNGNSVNVNAGNLFATGIETSYYYYPERLKNNKKTFAVNFGAHLGTNLSNSNSSIDLGFSSNAIKTFNINEKSNFNIGSSLGVLRKGLVHFKKDNLDFGTNDFIGYSETALEYNFKSKKGTVHTFGANFYIQTSLNKKDELEYIIPIRDENAFKSWGHGVTNLYKNNDYWSFIYSFTRKITISFYLQQDFTVSNNPDIQTGVGVSFEIKNKNN